jgi:hypothetical protein
MPATVRDWVSMLLAVGIVVYELLFDHPLRWEFLVLAASLLNVPLLLSRT